MSLQTYADLTAAVASWLNRTDLAGQIPDFIVLGETRIKRNQQWFRKIYSVANGTNLTITAQPMVLPADVRTIDAIWCDTDPWRGTIELLPPSAWRDLVTTNDDVTGIPTKAVFVPMMDTYLASEGPLLYLWPAPGDTGFAVDFTYLANPAPLSTAVNNLFLQHPDLYLYAALAETAPFLQHDERLPMWEARYQQIVSELKIERERAELGGNMVPRLPVSF